MFSFEAQVSGSKYGNVYMYLNGSFKHAFKHDDDGKNARQINFVVSQLLDVGDVITFHNKNLENSIYVASSGGHSSYPMTLVVYKIK